MNIPFFFIALFNRDGTAQILFVGILCIQRFNEATDQWWSVRLSKKDEKYNLLHEMIKFLSSFYRLSTIVKNKIDILRFVLRKE